MSATQTIRTDRPSQNATSPPATSSSSPPAEPQRPAAPFAANDRTGAWRRPRAAWLAPAAFIILAAAAGLALTSSRASVFSSADSSSVLTAVARQANLPVVIVGGGELESSDAVEVFCNVEGQQLKIIEMLPEGTRVEEGQVVLRLDPSEINDRLAQQQIKVTQADAAVKAAQEELKIQKNLAASAVAQAQLALRLADLDLKKYLQGDYSIELNDLKGSIALAEADLEEARDTVEHFRMLVKKGFRTPEQLRAKVQAAKRAEYTLDRDQEKLQVLEVFTRERQEAELTAEAEEAVRELDRIKSSSAAAVIKAETDLEVARAMSQLENKLLAKIQQQLADCDVRATAEGTLVYANTNNRRIEPGAVVHFKQKLFTLPDMSSMRVKAYVHESEVKKVDAGMPVEVRVDAFPNLVMHGAVKDVANFYDATRHWMSGGAKEYACTIEIQDMPRNAPLKPGMTAMVTIVAGRLDQGVIVPIPAVAEQDGAYFCYVRRDANLERRQVRLGGNTDNFVEVLKGLEAGEEVALDARRRTAEELQDAGSEARD